MQTLDQVSFKTTSPILIKEYYLSELKEERPQELFAAYIAYAIESGDHCYKKEPTESKAQAARRIIDDAAEEINFIAETVFAGYTKVRLGYSARRHGPQMSHDERKVRCSSGCSRSFICAFRSGVAD